MKKIKESNCVFVIKIVDGKKVATGESKEFGIKIRCTFNNETTDESIVQHLKSKIFYQEYIGR
jgi:hypothetical protein